MCFEFNWVNLGCRDGIHMYTFGIHAVWDLEAWLVDTVWIRRLFTQDYRRASMHDRLEDFEGHQHQRLDSFWTPCKLHLSCITSPNIFHERWLFLVSPYWNLTSQIPGCRHLLARINFQTLSTTRCVHVCLLADLDSWDTVEGIAAV